MPKHEYFENLCSLAALGKVSPEELGELEQHLRQCDSCRTASSDFDVISRALLFRAPVKKKSAWRFLSVFSGRNKYRERFLEKARERGIPFPPPEAGSGQPSGALVPLPSRHYKLALVGFLLLAMAGLLAYRLRESEARSLASAGENVQLRSENEELRKHMAETAQAFEAGLSRTRQEYAAALSRVSELAKQLELLSADADSLQARVSVEENNKAVLQQELEEARGRATELAGELSRLRTRQRAAATLLAAQNAEIDAFPDKLKAYQERLDRAEQLLMADRDIRNLMAARDLHITDVYDVDSRGRRRPPFGRVFYREGQLLVFYAFDFPEKTLAKAKQSFQAWGYQEPAVQSAQSLGIFYVDDADQRRWVLKTDDPQILQEIDAIFVTLEQRGGGKKPTGKKLLYAYLKDEPNHP